MKIGFTGTQQGMTKAQKRAFWTIINSYNLSEFHHGDCIGADFNAHQIVLAYNKSEIIIHPPINGSKRQNCKWFTEIKPAKGYLERNHDIVDSTDMLIATPKEYDEQLRSGTWATVRYARKTNKKLIIIYPDGSYDTLIKKN